MITYTELLAFAPSQMSRAEHDEWFESHGYSIDDLLRVGRELAEHRLGGLQEGAKLSQDDLTLTLISVFLFAVELVIRTEREEQTP